MVEKLYLTSEVFLSMACDYIIPMSQESLGDTDIESLTSEFGANVDFNNVELDGIPSMFRKAVNAADVTRHKVQRAFTNKHDPNRNHGLDNAKDRRDNEYLYKHDKRQLKHDERTERMISRNQRRDVDQERAEKYREIKDKRDDRTAERKTKRDAERGKYYHNGNNSNHVHETMHNHTGSVSNRNRSHDSHHTNNNQFHVQNPPRRQNDNVMHGDPHSNHHEQKQTRPPSHNPDGQDPFHDLPHDTLHEKKEYRQKMNTYEGEQTEEKDFDDLEKSMKSVGPQISPKLYPIPPDNGFVVNNVYIV